MSKDSTWTTSRTVTGFLLNIPTIDFVSRRKRPTESRNRVEAILEGNGLLYAVSALV